MFGNEKEAGDDYKPSRDEIATVNIKINKETGEIEVEEEEPEIPAKIETLEVESNEVKERRKKESEEDHVLKIAFASIFVALIALIFVIILSVT